MTYTYPSPSIIRMIKLRRMRTRREEEECMKDIDGKARRKETTRNTDTWVSG
jgi:hypothetical protein